MASIVGQETMYAATAGHFRIHKESVHYVYRVDGPAGTYIGRSVNPRQRWSAHVSAARHGRTQGSPLARAMAEGDVCDWEMTVVVGCVGVENACVLERELVMQAIASGESVLNGLIPPSGLSKRVLAAWE